MPWYLRIFFAVWVGFASWALCSVFTPALTQWTTTVDVIVGDYAPPVIALCVAIAAYVIATGREDPSGLEHEPRCRKCDYILRALTEPRCPECGEAI